MKPWIGSRLFSVGKIFVSLVCRFLRDGWLLGVYGGAMETSYTVLDIHVFGWFLERLLVRPVAYRPGSYLSKSSKLRFQWLR